MKVSRLSKARQAPASAAGRAHGDAPRRGGGRARGRGGRRRRARENKCCRWVFTLNNHTEEAAAIKSLSTDVVKFLVVGRQDPSLIVLQPMPDDYGFTEIECFAAHYGDLYLNLRLLASVLMVIPVSTADNVNTLGP
uniref:Uncharacterized protein n=1 Tax=Branchiostoma floridae TaxID=7739 RepID=C3YXZ7_BRAFL|eukprot:XP_002598944.1 hypothetical protein BRAFLDRAFT_79874 [Branchiostoma floridae]